jgi:hypothetical protein
LHSFTEVDTDVRIIYVFVLTENFTLGTLVLRSSTERR